MVVEIFMLLKCLSMCWNFWSDTCFIFLCLLLCSSWTCLFTRFLCIGSMLDLNVFWICLLMLSFASNTISCECIIKTAEPILTAIKKRTSWEITHVLFCYSTLFYICVLEVVYYCSNLSLSYFIAFVVPSKVFDSKVNTRFGLLRRNRFLAVTNLGLILCR